MMFQVVSAVIAVYFSCVFFDAPKKLSWYIALLGGAGWLVFLMFQERLGTYSATYISGLFIAFLSHLAARKFKTPVTVFFIPGFFPLVPGAGMYRTVYWYIMKDPEMGKHYLNETFMVAGMIALAIFTIDSLFKVYSIISKDFRNHLWHSK